MRVRSKDKCEAAENSERWEADLGYCKTLKKFKMKTNNIVETKKQDTK